MAHASLLLAYSSHTEVSHEWLQTKPFASSGEALNSISSKIRHSFSSSEAHFAPKRASASNSLYTPLGLPPIRALQRRLSDENPELRSTEIPSYPSSFQTTNTWSRSKTLTTIQDNDPVWERIGAGLRITYAAGIYAVMALAGQGICHFTGIDNAGGFEMCPDVAMQGLGYAVPPMMALLFILDDEVVKKSAPARAIRDVEDEELMSFFIGMSPWQLMLVITMDAVAEELFFRIAIQGGLTHAFLSDDKLNGSCNGIVALMGMFPSIAPFAHAVAAVLTAALTGTILYITSFPQDPAYVITKVHRRSSPMELKRSFSAWYERRQLKRIYSPLLDSLLALYLGFEWLQTGNILAPIITHVVYSTVIVGNGLRRIYEQRKKLRQRTRSCWEREQSSISDLQSKLK